MRALKEGQIQTVRVEIFDSNARDAVERFQDYGLASNPVDGQGLAVECDGHVVVLRMDRLAERPQLAAHEVSVWHKDGHRITLTDGKKIIVDCDEYIVNAKTKAAFNTPLIEAPSAIIQAKNVQGSEGGTFGGVDSVTHAHDGVQRGNDQSGGPVK
ncbi:phage baseplate assembly protein domain-containing protein [Collimonas antrihumi]|uniref:phage baseplate assembly protein domain-containing protein n=1 Tax=Collimonas antrihumi TaxID=1940615 RepID=UPI001FEC8BB2|nr:phage baseplate assembly protein [Collimonas antrihumi]